jgi:hypothetical protein
MALEHLDRFMWMCLKRSSIGYQYYLRFASPEEAKRLILQMMYRMFRWPNDVLGSRDQEHLRELLEGDFWPDVLMQWLLRAGFSSTRWSESCSWSESIERLFDLPSIRKKWGAALQTHLDGIEKEAQRELLVELRVKKAAAEALASEKKEPASLLGGGAEVPREQGNVIAYMGATWKITSEGNEGTVRDCKGVRFLALLLQSPGESFHAKELHGLAAGKLPDQGTELESADPRMDETAKNKLKLELERLKLERASAHDEGDDYELVRIDQEFDRLAEEARRISHPKACYSSGTEKARKNVSNQVAQTIRDLAEIPGLRPLSKHLKNSIKKGKFLSYQGGLRWVVELPPAKKSAAKCF